MQYRYLGKQRLKVSAIGYGCPTFQGKLSDRDERRDIDVLHRAIDLGINFIDTADHNNGNNEELLAKALKGKRDLVVLASKFGNLRGQPWADTSGEGARLRLGEMRIKGLLVWALADNEAACGFYLRQGGKPIAEGAESFGDATLRKIAFAWA